MTKVWEATEVEALTRLWPEGSYIEISRSIPDKSIEQCKNKAGRMGIRRKLYEQTTRKRKANKVLSKVERHHRNMIRKYFGGRALQEHIQAQQGNA